MQRYRGTCSGNCPLAVSPLSMTQSAPSRMALATSDDSARVGRGFLIMLSSICVAQTIGLPARLHRPIIIFCARKIFSVGISMPRSPRATITPSVTSRISSNRLTPSWFSIFEMILILRPLSPRTCCARARYCYPAIRGSSHIVYVYSHLVPPSDESRGGTCVCWIVGCRYRVCRRRAAESCASSLGDRVVATIVNKLWIPSSVFIWPASPVYLSPPN